MKEFQNKQLHFAVIIDEFSSVLGIVTLEDVIESIVGEIWDEHDQKEDEIKQINDNTYLVSGKTSIKKLFNLLDINEEVESHIVNGWVMEELNTIPQVGMEFNKFGLNIKVIGMNGRIIDSVEIIKNKEEQL